MFYLMIYRFMASEMIKYTCKFTGIYRFSMTKVALDWWTMHVLEKLTVTKVKSSEQLLIEKLNAINKKTHPKILNNVMQSICKTNVMVLVLSWIQMFCKHDLT